jgi:hypothetical protein
MVIRKIFSLVFVLFSGAVFFSVEASADVPLCNDMILQVLERGRGETVSGKRDDGRFVRLKVVSSARKENCPPPGMVYRVSAVINEFRIRADLFALKGEAKEGSFELRNVRSLRGARLPGVSELLLGLEQ